MQTLFVTTLLLLSQVEPIPIGKATVEVQFGDVAMKLFTYKPESFRNGPMLMVFHGVLRNAEEYRDHSVSLGDKFQALIVAPHFDEKSFGKGKYQLGGIVIDGKAVSPEERTGQYVNRIAKVVRTREGRDDLPYSLIGHSGGGQFSFAWPHSCRQKLGESSLPIPVLTHSRH